MVVYSHNIQAIIKPMCRAIIVVASRVQSHKMYDYVSPLEVCIAHSSTMKATEYESSFLLSNGLIPMYFMTKVYSVFNDEVLMSSYGR